MKHIKDADIIRVKPELFYDPQFWSLSDALYVAKLAERQKNDSDWSVRVDYMRDMFIFNSINTGLLPSWNDWKEHYSSLGFKNFGPLNEAEPPQKTWNEICFSLLNNERDIKEPISNFDLSGVILLDLRLEAEPKKFLRNQKTMFNILGKVFSRGIYGISVAVTNGKTVSQEAMSASEKVKTRHNKLTRNSVYLRVPRPKIIGALPEGKYEFEAFVNATQNSVNYGLEGFIAPAKFSSQIKTEVSGYDGNFHFIADDYDFNIGTLPDSTKYMFNGSVTGRVNGAKLLKEWLVVNKVEAYNLESIDEVIVAQKDQLEKAKKALHLAICGVNEKTTFYDHLKNFNPEKPFVPFLDYVRSMQTDLGSPKGNDEFVLGLLEYLNSPLKEVGDPSAKKYHDNIIKVRKKVEQLV